LNHPRTDSSAIKLVILGKRAWIGILGRELVQVRQALRANGMLDAVMPDRMSTLRTFTLKHRNTISHGNLLPNSASSQEGMLRR